MLNDMAPCEELFHTAAGSAFADITVDDHRETWPIRSKRFRGWLRRRYYQATGGAASAAEIRSALDLFEARAQFDGPERAVHVRIGEQAGHIYLDLADERWRGVDIGPDGWRVIGCPPVRFRRPAGMLPLPVPQQGGSIEALASFLNLPSRDDFVLIVAWLLGALRSSGPYPLSARCLLYSREAQFGNNWGGPKLSRLRWRYPFDIGACSWVGQDLVRGRTSAELGKFA
jgi:hypothetical protein